ncbi:MAG: YlmH/Sll1252 family protein [Solobacterium sp.]|jgi:RNA-binding protein YlmH|nr:YlmH/Sll1252 family protein [Solobacterium sp.]MCH4227112.1 YlmH/Sll1252 family protein [Solobacterium sp.]MCH4282316.1 YlmH/Sll1252 family protein [Solobacterium sp.]
MTDASELTSLAAHLHDLEEKSRTWHKSLASSFLNEEEQSAMEKLFPPSSLIRYDGGYPEARKKKVIFLADEEDGFSDIVCLEAKADQRFRRIGHSDILGALMHLQIDRSSFGDFWLEGDHLYLYTSAAMAPFLIDQLTRINQLSISLQITEERPVQVFHTKKITCVAASNRADALVAALAHVSRVAAKEMIHAGLVQFNHVSLEEPDQLCDNNVTISIRGIGRFTYIGTSHSTKSGRIAAEFLQYM